MQGEAESALGELQRVRQEQGKAQAEAAAAVQDAREALARERDIQDQLQKADQVTGLMTLHSCRPSSSLVPMLACCGSDAWTLPRIQRGAESLSNSEALPCTSVGAIGRCVDPCLVSAPCARTGECLSHTRT